LIERFGIHLIGEGHRIAVLAIDPSSRISGGSILGDKTRMAELAARTEAFIRPSPAGTTPGGVARRTREALLLCEAAGFDVVVVETVGVGQSETAVADMTDLLVLLVQPGGGDDLQGIKRGIVELADLLVVTKADGELAAAAGRAAADYRHALHQLRGATASGGWFPPVLQCSGLTGQGLAEIWQAIGRFREAAAGSGRFARRRADQALAWLREELSQGLLDWLAGDPELARRLADAEAAVHAGTALPPAAARGLLVALRTAPKTPRPARPG
jgi:LAO/AO transport system kinase